ncbi:unnamed protein product [Nyctereutes procyonoides]|uniref:(raccoon dog) hypothetical protein n=1 Tax=Nyctereutes procyonoides TaxID=34880 RepID=A0A811Y3W7_NYCPR|nr:unnamed protein product [Nyctereutes procyonoides]
MACPLDQAIGREGDKNILTKKELTQKEFPTGLTLQDADIAKVMGDLDQNKDQAVKFQEYITFLGAIMLIYNNFRG